MNKNPFEVRLDIIKMAQDMLDKEQAIKMEKYNSTIRTMQMAMQLSQVSPGEVRSYIDGNEPAMYTQGDVVQKATELYNFVSSSSRVDSSVINNIAYNGDIRKGSSSISQNDQKGRK